MCIFNTRWLSYFKIKGKLSDEEIRINRIKLLPFTWKYDKNYKYK